MNSKTSHYYRPGTHAELAMLLAQAGSQPIYLAGGNYYEQPLDPESLLIDLEEIGFGGVNMDGGKVKLGSLSRLADIGHAFLDWPDLQAALIMETGTNVRNSLSLLNFVNSADGRSPFLAVLCAFRPSVHLLPAETELALDDYLGQRRKSESVLFSEASFAKPRAFAFDAVARTPMDRPIVCLALAEMESDEVFAALGGTSQLPKVIRLSKDYALAAGAVRQAYQDSGDQWASAEYRQEVAEVLLSRCLQKLGMAALRKEEK